MQAKPIELQNVDQIQNLNTPTLIAANWCPFTEAAKSFWKQASEDVGATLQVVDAESPEGAQVIQTAGAAGVPCLIAAKNQLHYGLQYSPEQASSLIRHPVSTL